MGLNNKRCFGQLSKNEIKGKNEYNVLTVNLYGIKSLMVDLSLFTQPLVSPNRFSETTQNLHKND